VLVPPSTGFFCEYGYRRESVGSVRPLFAPVAGELMPGQSQLDETLPVGTFGRHGALHRRLGFMLWIVLGTHEANSSRTIWTSAWQFRPYDCGVNAVLGVCDSIQFTRLSGLDAHRSVKCVTAGARRLR
jgi:hypothetical protein